MSIRITAYNRGPDPADLHILPQLFFRNTWSWSKDRPEKIPHMHQETDGVVNAWHDTLGTTRLYCTPSPAPAAPAKGGVVLVDGPSVVPELLFTENETNFERLYNGKNRTPYVKDAFHDHIIPSHRPKEPEPERDASQGLETKKSPAISLRSLPGDSTDPMSPQNISQRMKENGDGTEEISEELRDCNFVSQEHEPPQHENGNGSSSAHVEPPPRPTSGTGARRFVNPEKIGTKAGAHYHFTNVPGKGGCVVVRLKMTPSTPEEDPSILDEEMYDDTIEERRIDADEFYGRIARNSVSDDLRNIMRQALSGMLW